MRVISEMRKRRFSLPEAKQDMMVSDGDTGGSLNSDHAAALPNARWYDGGTPYFHYRAMTLAASLPDTPKIGVSSFSQDMPFSSGYTQVDDDIISAAAKLCGYPGKRLSNSRSIEGEDIYKSSPVNHNSGKHPSIKDK
jgi:hypothetical protein